MTIHLSKFAIFVLVTVATAFTSLMLGGAFKIFSACPQPPDWLPGWAIGLIVASFFGSPLIGLVAAVCAPGRDRGEVG